MENTDYKQLLSSEDEHIEKLHSLVLESLDEEKLISKKRHEKEKLSFSEKISDKVAEFGGSWKFIISFLLMMLLWILSNVYFLTKGFDPFPFILLNLVLSCVAALQAPIIMMSQNRKEEKDRKRAENDYLVNLKAEIEIRNLHQKIDLLMMEQMKILLDFQKAQLEILEEVRSSLKKTDK